VNIIFCNDDDVSELVKVHLSTFQNFFLTFLGPRFLRLLYKNLIIESAGILIVAKEQNKIIGFVGGVTNQSGFYHNLVKKNLFAFAFSSFGAFIRKPSIAPRLFRALAKSRDSGESVAEACLMSIAVLPNFAGKGVGKKLVHAFATELNKRGCEKFCLTTDALENERTNLFYQSLGFKLARTYSTTEKRVMNEYVGVVSEMI
jgi:ribosomal protein S18 acetylase RimI-like enzyme